MSAGRATLSLPNWRDSESLSGERLCLTFLVVNRDWCLHSRNAGFAVLIGMSSHGWRWCQHQLKSWNFIDGWTWSLQKNNLVVLEINLSEPKSTKDLFPQCSLLTPRHSSTPTSEKKRKAHSLIAGCTGDCVNLTWTIWEWKEIPNKSRSWPFVWRKQRLRVQSTTRSGSVKWKWCNHINSSLRAPSHSSKSLKNCSSQDVLSACFISQYDLKWEFLFCNHGLWW